MIPFLFGASHRSHTVCLVVSYRSNQVKNLVAPMYLLIFSHHSSNNAWRFSSK